MNNINSQIHAYDLYAHATPKGTGTAVKIELHPADGEHVGYILLHLALQEVESGIGAMPTFAWGEAEAIKLSRDEISQLLQVLRGMCESISDGKGLFHRYANHNTVIKFSHQINPQPGYLLSTYAKPSDGPARERYYQFNMNEAFSLMLSLERALLYVCFGIPQI